MSDTKPETQNADTITGGASFGSRVKAHFRKWWWIYVIVFIIVVLVVVLPVVYVGYPRIAQHDVNESSLEVISLSFTNPRPNAVHANQTQRLTNKSKYHPKIYSFNNTISLLTGEDDSPNPEPITWAIVPEFQANDGELIIVDTDLQLDNIDAATKFTGTALSQDEFQLRLYGKPDLKQGGLPKINVEFNKTATIKGLNGLQGLEIRDVNIMIVPDDEGNNMNGSVVIPNPGHLTIEMGNVTLDVSVDGHHIGQSFLRDLVIRPGENIVPLTSAMNQTYVIGLLSGDDAPYRDGVLPLEIRGNRSEYNGEVIPYYTRALAATTLHTSLNLTEPLEKSGLADLLLGGGDDGN
ncbi:hypothetical protein VTN31DRAFT_3403 [Thermomyces dupontii]|uniref:uncharacterized protein n=1 Tax=Talaromyces thermophilus TaxID=28565 RepID=UPI00374274FA